MSDQKNLTVFPTQPWEKGAGMSLRDHLAAMALLGLLSGHHLERVHLLAKKAYEIADAMLLVRNEDSLNSENNDSDSHQSKIQDS